MLIEEQHASQVPNDYFRRWFKDENLDLIVWYKTDGAIYGFQICYDRADNEKALRWLSDRGFSHYGVDSGEESPLSNRTPLFVTMEGCFETAQVLSRFRSSDERLPRQLRALVRRKLREYGRLHRQKAK